MSINPEFVTYLTSSGLLNWYMDESNNNVLVKAELFNKFIISKQSVSLVGQ